MNNPLEFAAARRWVVGVLVTCSAWGVLRSDVRGDRQSSAEQPAARLAAAPAGDREGSGPLRKAAADPVALNGKIFVDWPIPKAALLLSGDMDGYIEPCGCAGLENQKGGLKRRHSLVRQLESQGWPIVSLDVGGLARRTGVQAEIKYRRALESLVKIGYAAVGLGPDDLRLSTDALAYAVANVDPERNPLLSANAGIYSLESGLTQRYRVAEAGGKRIGVTHVLGAEHVAAVGRDDLELLDPAAALTQTAPLLADQKCDKQVLLVHGNPREAQQLARQFPQFDVVVAAGGAEEPPNRPGTIEGSRALLVETGHKGMYVIVVGLYDDPKTPFRYQRVPLDARFPDSPAMQEQLVAYQKELEQMTLKGLGLTGSSHPEAAFVGSEACADCHAEATAKFLETPHAHATDTLVDLDPPRHFDPECLSCHVTGWNPQEYFPYASGYFGLAETPHLRQNGCENCHGPGSDHVAAESGAEDVGEAEQEARRDATRLRIEEHEGNKEGQVLGRTVKMCLECHDLDNSPDFDFQQYWRYVEHSEKD